MTNEELANQLFALMAETGLSNITYIGYIQFYPDILVGTIPQLKAKLYVRPLSAKVEGAKKGRLNQIEN